MNIGRMYWIGVLLVAQVVSAGEPSRLRYTSDKTTCVEFARDLERVATRDGKPYYFVVGYTIRNRPHAFIVVDGWVIDNGNLHPRRFKEKDIPKYMKPGWKRVDHLPKGANILVDDSGNIVGVVGEEELNHALSGHK